jgi:hypothetical protein
LHDVPDDSKFVEITTSTLCAKRLLESDLHVGDEAVVEARLEQAVCESKYEKVLDHFLAQVVIDTEGLSGHSVNLERICFRA